MVISNIIDGSFGLISKQLHFYCHRFRRRIGAYQKEEIIELVVEQRFDQLAKHIANLCQNNIWDHRQQVSKLLIEQCYLRTSRRQLLFKLIQNKLIDIDVRLDSYGRTLLHRSAYNLDVELVKLLTENNVGVRLRDYAGNTALHIAIQSYRNGALLSEAGPMVKKNLSSIIKLLLEMDKANMKNHFSSLLVSQAVDSHQYARRSLTDCAYNAKKTAEPHNRKPILMITRNSKDFCQELRHKHLGSLNRCNKSSRKHNLEEHYDPSELTLNKVLGNQESSNRVQLIMLPDYSTSMVNTKNAFGRTALHYCVLLIGEKHLSHFVELLLDYGADPNSVDAKMKTPFYCLIKRPDMTDISYKCASMRLLLANDCDDLGLALNSDHHLLRTFNSALHANDINNANPDANNNHFNRMINPIVNRGRDESDEGAIAVHSVNFKRVPDLKHLARLSYVRNKKLFSQVQKNLLPLSLLSYLERRLIDQSEFI